MIQFLKKHKHKLMMIGFLFVLLLSLTSCRTNANAWTTDRPYVDGWAGYSNEFYFNDSWEAMWGWPVSILSWPIAWICSHIGKGLGNSFFWGILFTTLIVRTIAWPIYSKQNSMSLKMTLMQPEMTRIQRKYGNRKDPQSQQQMQMEMMKIYKKYKVNPLGCILPMFIQFPIFMAMYEVVRRINASSVVNVNGINVVEYGTFALKNTKLFNFFELNTSFMAATEIKDKIFAVVIALAFGGLTILSQKLAQKKPKYLKDYNNNRGVSDQQQQQQKQMKIMTYVMNIMFVFMALSSTSLALYWLIGAIYQLFQSFVGRKINELNYYKAQKKNTVL